MALQNMSTIRLSGAKFFWQSYFLCIVNNVLFFFSYQFFSPFFPFQLILSTFNFLFYFSVPPFDQNVVVSFLNTLSTLSCSIFLVFTPLPDWKELVPCHSQMQGSTINLANARQCNVSRLLQNYCFVQSMKLMHIRNVAYHYV